MTPLNPREGHLALPEIAVPPRPAGQLLRVLCAAFGVAYLLINLAILYVLPMSRRAGDPLVAGAAANAVFGPAGDPVIRTIMIISALGAVSACQLMAPRVIFAMSRDRLMPASVSEVNPGGTPTVATVASTAVARLHLRSQLPAHLHLGIRAPPARARYPSSLSRLGAVPGRYPQQPLVSRATRGELSGVCRNPTGPGLGPGYMTRRVTCTVYATYSG